MSEYFISFEDANEDLLAAAAYLGERIKSSDGHAAAMAAVVPRYLVRNNVDLAAELANTVDDPFTRDKLLTSTAEKCVEIDDDEYAMQLANAIEDVGLRQQAYERIAIQKAAKDHFDKAIEIAESMQHPDMVFAVAAARAASIARRDLSSDLLGRIEYPSAKVSAQLAIAAHEFANDNSEASVAMLDDALLAAKEIEHNEERIRTICEVGNQYVAIGRNDLAIDAYNTAKEFAEQLDNVHRDAFIAAAVMGFLHAGSMDTADRTLDLVTDKTQMSNCLLAFSKYLWERDEKEEALEALDESYQILRSQKEMETRDGKARFGLFGSIAAQYAGFGKAERSIEIASAIEDDSFRTAALAQISAVFTLHGEDGHARQSLNEIADDAERASALIGMSDAKEQSNDREGGLALLDEATHLVDEIQQLTPRSWAYNEIARRYVDRGEMSKAKIVIDHSIRTIVDIRDESNRAAALSAVSDLFIEGQLETSDEQRKTVEKLLFKV